MASLESFACGTWGLIWRRNMLFMCFVVVIRFNSLQAFPREIKDIPSTSRISEQRQNVRSASELMKDQPTQQLQQSDRANESVLSDDTTSNPSDDDFVEEFIDEVFGSLSDDGIGNNITELFDEVFDEMFGPLDGNSTNSTENVDDDFLNELALEEFVDEVFDISADDAFSVEPVSEPLKLVPTVSPLTSKDKGEDSPAALNSTDGTSEIHIDDSDTPKSPLVRASTSSPVRSPTLLPSPLVKQTETPTLGQMSDDEENDSKTEHDVDDDFFNEETYKSRPGGSIPGGSSVTAILGTLAAIAAMIFTAWQVSDNPDGIFASMCRLVLTCIQLVCRVMMSPCRKYLPCCYTYRGHMTGSNGYHEPYGHIPVSTMDYGYKDPALELT